MLDRSAWCNLIPHQGRMALIDRVVDHDVDSIHAQSDNHRASDHPLRSGGRLHAVHLCEYGAQAMAVHGALVASGSGGCARPGLLVALRAVQLRVARIDDLPGVLVIRAWREHADDQAWLYRFTIDHAGSVLADGQAMVMLERSVDASTHEEST